MSRPPNVKAGAPKGNRNAIRHGLKASKLPAGCAYIEVRINDIRRRLEDAVIECKGKVSITDAATIQTCIRWERHAALAQRWLNKQFNKLKPAQQLYFSREIARASSERDKALADLGLDEDYQQGIIDALYTRQPSITHLGDNDQ